jgi:glycosyltransferase involved in cell wall biosynthesis
MKIAMVTQDGLSTVNFCTPFVRHLAAEQGSDIEIVTISTSDIYAEEIRALGTRHFEMDVDRYADPVGDLRYAWRMYRLFRREPFDAVVSFGTKPNSYVPFIARFAGVPAVIMAIRGLGRVFSGGTGGGGAVRTVLETLYRASANASDKVWLTNDGDRAHFVEAGLAPFSKTFMTRNGVNVEVFTQEAVPAGRVNEVRAELGLAPDDFVVVMVARMVWAKGIREFAEACRAVRAADPAVRFVLVGPPEEGTPNAIPAEFMDRIEQDYGVDWIGFRKDVRDVYAASDVAALPSYYKEGGYPRALLEPMAMAKPVIAADTPDCRGPVEDGVSGYLVTPRDSGHLAELVQRLRNDPELRDRMGRAARQRIHEVFDDRLFARKVISELLLLTTQSR